MSVIQTIRQKYLGLMIGAIVVALLGFLFMDSRNSNSGSIFGGNDRSFGSVNGTEISNTEYVGLEQRYLENARSKNPKMTEAETEEVKSQVWDDLVNQKLLEAQKLMRGHLKRLKTQYEDVKHDDYRLGLLKMKFN